MSPVSAAAAAAAASFIVNPSFASLAWPSSMAPSHPNHAALQSPSSFLGWMRANAAAHPPHGGSLSPSSLSKFFQL